MAKRKQRRSKSNEGTVRARKPHATKVGRRVDGIDTLRGFAIALMIVDHLAWAVWDIGIQAYNVRFFTRLSMPLFCLLLGYFLARRERVNWTRVAQLAAAAFALNFFYYTFFRHVEILASLLVCVLVYAALGRWFLLLLPACAAFAWDPSNPEWQAPSSALSFLGWIRFDYSLTVVAPCVAIGVLQRKWGDLAAIATAAGVAILGAVSVTQPTSYVLGFLPVASIMLWAVRKYSSQLRIPPLTLMGRYPLTVYLAQYAIILLATDAATR